MSTLNDIFKKLEDKTELSSHEVHLATVDDIKFQLKSISQLNDRYNKLDAIVQKNVGPLNTAYKEIVLNKDYAKKITPVLDRLQTALQKQATELGIDYKQLPAFKELMDAYSFVSQVNDSIGNSMGAVQSIGK
jgi:hypothetical protein